MVDWFTRVKMAEWLIVLDTTRAKENKSRGQVLEKVGGGGQEKQNAAANIF